MGSLNDKFVPEGRTGAKGVFAKEGHLLTGIKSLLDDFVIEIRLICYRLPQESAI